jgi:ABC-type branched-subunit amino acid transport system ATPase component
MRLRAEEALDYIGISPTQWQRIALELPYGLQRKVEIARAVAMQATTFLLDEPAAGLNGSETSALSDLFLKLRADGKCVILIEHNMEMVMRISDHVVVMNFGRKIAEGRPYEVQANAAVVEAYLGVEEEEC